ncbi:hypothetical protein NCCP2050_34570 [Planococcus sp. NCCP-2050]|nr:hypothetical protein NCCP2050_34570 [Planococcus sp. NCCP-2050]
MQISRMNKSDIAHNSTPSETEYLFLFYHDKQRKKTVYRKLPVNSLNAYF